MSEPILELGDRLARAHLPLNLGGSWPRHRQGETKSTEGQRKHSPATSVTEQGGPGRVESHEKAGGTGGCEEVRRDLEESIEFLECCLAALFRQPGVAGAQPDYDREHAIVAPRGRGIRFVERARSEPPPEYGPRPPR